MERKRGWCCALAVTGIALFPFVTITLELQLTRWIHGPMVRIWEASSGEEVAALRGEVIAAEFSPDGKFLATAHDKCVKLWSVPSFKQVHALSCPTGNRPSIKFSKDGKLITAYDNISVSTWRARDGKLLYYSNIRDSDGDSESVKLSADGKWLAYLAYTDTDTDKAGCEIVAAKLWHLPEGKLVRKWETREIGNATSIDLSPDGRMLAVSGDRITVWHLPHDKLFFSAEAEDDNNSPPDRVAFSPDGKLLAVWGKRIQLFSLPDGKMLHTLEQDPYGYQAFAFTPDGSFISSIGNEKDSHVLKLWRVKDGVAIGKWKITRVYVRTGLAFSPDGRMLAGGEQVSVVNLSKGGKIRDFQDYSDRSRSVIFSPDSKFIATVNYDSSQPH